MTDPLLGRVLRGKYRVERRLGQGGMGVVYAAVHLELARPVALKTLLDVRDADDVDRLRTEALAAASLAHPHIVSVTDFAAAKGDEPAFLVMELLAGRSLDRVLVQRGALATGIATHIALQMLDAIGAAHNARILHRDIKPANVIVLDGADAERPWIKVVDFGIAKLMDDASRHTATGVMMGTPAYMAPEQLRAEKATEAVDIYAIGVCLYEMLAGTRPFAKTGGELASEILRGEAPALPIEPALAAVVQRAMHRDAAQRFASCSDFAKAVREATTAQEKEKAAPSAARPKWPIFVGVTAATAVAATIAGALAIKPAREHEMASDATSDVAPTDVAPNEPAPTDADVDDALAAPRVEEDARAPARAAGPGEVLSICADGPYTLCTRLMWTCDCWTSDGTTVLDSAERWAHPHSLRTTEGKAKRGTSCRGFTHAYSPEGEYRAIPAVGRYRCVVSCDTQELLAGRRMAVPGTPCVGYTDEVPRPGKWRRFVQ